MTTSPASRSIRSSATLNRSRAPGDDGDKTADSIDSVVNFLADADVSLLREMIADAGGKYGTAAKHFGISTAQAWRIANFQRRRAA